MMYIECIAICAVLAIMIFMIARTGRQTTALAFLPLLIVPISYLLSNPVSSMLAAVLPLGRAFIAIGVTVLGLVIGCVLFGMLCGNFPTRRMRRIYLFMCGGFSTILTVVLIFNLLAVLEHRAA